MQFTWLWAFFRIKFPDETFQEKITWHLININRMVYLADAMGLYTWWKHVKVCLSRLFIKTTRRNAPNYWTPKYEIQNVLVQERSAGGRYDIGIYYFHQYFQYLKQQISPSFTYFLLCIFWQQWARIHRKHVLLSILEWTL